MRKQVFLVIALVLFAIHASAQDPKQGQDANPDLLAEYQAEVDKLRGQATEARKRIETAFDAEVVKLKQRYAERLETLRVAAMDTDNLDAAISLRDLKTQLDGIASPLESGVAEPAEVAKEPAEKLTRQQPKVPEFFTWKQGEPPTKMIRSDEGFAVITSVNGMEHPDASLAEIVLGKDDFWYLQGRGFLHLKAIAIPFGKIIGGQAQPNDKRANKSPASGFSPAIVLEQSVGQLGTYFVVLLSDGTAIAKFHDATGTWKRDGETLTIQWGQDGKRVIDSITVDPKDLSFVGSNHAGQQLTGRVRVGNPLDIR